MSQNKIQQTRELSDEELRKIGVVVNPDYKYVLGIFPVKEYKVSGTNNQTLEGVAKTEAEGIWFSGSKRKSRKTRRNTKRNRR